MKKTLKKVIICGFSLSILIGASFVIYGDPFELASTEYKIKHPLNSEKYNENPAPVFENNLDKDSSKLLSQEDILKKADNPQDKSQKSILKKVKLTTWDKHLKDDEENSQNKSYLIDPNRQVYVVFKEYPDGFNTRIGVYANAKLMCTYDAETGELLETAVGGDFQGSYECKIAMTFGPCIHHRHSLYTFKLKIMV